MKNFLKIFLFFLTAFVVNSVTAQDAEFSQFYSNTAYLNPAFVGNRHCPKMTTSYRNQWSAIAGNYSTAMAIYEQNTELLKGGFGFILFNDESGSNLLSTNSISALYSNQQRLTEKLYVRAGLQATYTQKRLNWDGLTFPDMIDPQLGFIFQTQQPIVNGMAKYMDFSTGIVLYNDKSFLGFSAHHLNRPNESLSFGESYLPTKYTVHLSTTLPLSNIYNNESTVSPSLMYRQQGDFKQLNAGLNVNKDNLLFGLWYRGWLGEDYRDALIPTLGIKMDNLSFIYSYDFNIAELISYGANTHEISLIVNLDCNGKRNDKVRPIPCYAFFN